MRFVFKLYILYKQIEYIYYEIFVPVSPTNFNCYILSVSKLYQAY